MAAKAARQEEPNLALMEQAPEEPAQKPKKAKKVKAVKETVELPVLVEVGLSFSAALLLLVDVAVGVISYLTGASLLVIFTRLLVSTAAMGILVWLFSWQLSTGVLQGAQRYHQEELERMAAEQKAALERADHDNGLGTLENVQA